MKKNRYLLLVVCIALFQACITFIEHNDESSEFQIQNNSDSAIYVCITQSNSLPIKSKLKLFDTLKVNGKDSIISPIYRINAHSFNKDHLLFDNYQKNKSNNNLYIYFIKEVIIESRSWENICKTELYSQKISINKNQLNIDKNVIFNAKE